jgi:hypothetical protein
MIAICYFIDHHFYYFNLPLNITNPCKKFLKHTRTMTLLCATFVFLVTIELNKDITTDSFGGWAIQIREYGRRDLGSNTTYPVGSIVSFDG